MTVCNLNLYSAEDPTPRQFDVVQGLIYEYMHETGIAVSVSTQGSWNVRHPVLVLGSEGPSSGVFKGLQYTYSAKQLESRPNAKTVFFAALDTYFGRVKGLPEYPEVRTFWNAKYTQLNFERLFDLSEPIAIDVETGGVLGETVTPRTAPMLTIAFAQGKIAVVMKLPNCEGIESEEVYAARLANNLQFLQEILPQIEKPIWHNGKFDIAVIEANTGVRMPNWFDTMLAHHTLNMAAREHGLKALCKRYFNADDWEEGINRWIKGKSQDYSVIPIEELALYNGYDVLWTYRLWQKMQLEIEADEDAQKAFYLEMQTADFLYDIEQVGIPVSEQEIDNLLVDYGDIATDTLRALRDVVGDTAFNPGSHVQIKKWLTTQGIVVASTDEENIKKLKQEFKDESTVYNFCCLLLDYRKAKKMQGTYVKGWWKAAMIEGDSRAHPTFNVHGTVTGRLSSSNPNAQNVPRDKTIRKMVTINDVNQLV